MNPNSFSLAPSALSTFAASLTALPSEEIRKAKSLFIRNAIADYEMIVSSSRGMVITMGILSIIPVFLIVFIPTLISYRAAKKNGKQKIINALEVWKEELEEDYHKLLEEVSQL